MDIAFINRMIGLTRGGGEVWDLNMAKQLQQMGHSITFYIGKPLFAEVTNPIEQFDVVEIPTPHLKEIAYGAPPGVGGLLHDLDSQFFTRRIASRIVQEKHDIIQVCSDPRFGRVSDRLSCPVSLVLHGTPYSLWHDLVNPRSSSYHFFSKFDTILATGNTSYKADFPAEKITTINPGVDPEHFHPDGPSEQWDSLTILYVGRFVPAKNITGLLSSFRNLIETGVEAQLVLVGEGPLKSKIERKARDLGVRNSVRFTGFISNEQLPRYYRGADVFALSSHHESFGMVLLEAMACELPVVAPRVDYIPNIVEDGRTGLLYDQGNLQGLSTATRTLLTDRHRRNSIGEASREFVTKVFSWEAQAEKLVTEYQVLHQRNDGPV